MDPLIHVNIKDRSKVFFDGEVMAVSSFNDVGLFDVLPMHENFITLIKNVIILHDKGSQRELKITNGLLKVKESKVNIYLGV